MIETYLTFTYTIGGVVALLGGAIASAEVSSRWSGSDWTSGQVAAVAVTGFAFSPAVAPAAALTVLCLVLRFIAKGYVELWRRFLPVTKLPKARVINV